MSARFRIPLTLETPERSSDGAGGFETTWRALGIHYADITPRTGRDAGGVAGPISSVPMRIQIRGCPPSSPARPKPEQRFRTNARVFSIEAVTEADAAGRVLTINAREEVAQ